LLFNRDATVLAWLKENHVDVVFVPGGCTAVAQVMDVFVNAKFKSTIRKFLLSWKAQQIKVQFHSPNHPSRPTFSPFSGRQPRS
jgi:hypothetical protein